VGLTPTLAAEDLDGSSVRTSSPSAAPLATQPREALAFSRAFVASTAVLRVSRTFVRATQLREALAFVRAIEV
jgi:hypothetical protein